MNSRKDAPGKMYCLRRIAPTSDYWREPPTGHGHKPGHYRGSEVSVDIFDRIPDDSSLRTRYTEYINRKGVGFTASVVEKINHELEAHDFKVTDTKYDDEKGTIGRVKEDPIDGNSEHSVITGAEKVAIPNSSEKLKKSVVLYKLFETVLDPMPFDQIHRIH